MLNKIFDINIAINTKERIARFGEAMPNWLTIKESTVLVIPFP